MFKEVHTLEDLKFVHFVVLIFRDADQCEKYCIYLDKMKLSTYKQYWALVTDVNTADEIHTKDGFYVDFKGDDNRIHQLWIPCDLCENGLTAYIFRTPDESVSYTGFLVDKVVERLEKFVVPYTKHSEAHDDDDRYQSVQDRNQDIEVIKQVCEEEGLCDLVTDKVEVEWIHWRKEKHYYRVHIYYKSGDSYDFNVYVGKNVIDANKERQETLKKEIAELSKTIEDETIMKCIFETESEHQWKMIDHLRELRDIKARELKELEEADHG